MSILLLDESGFMLAPLVQRTWAPRGCTPILRVPGRREKVSAITGLTVSPRRRRIGMYFVAHDDNIKKHAVIDFIRWVRRQVGNKLIVILDRAGIHRAAVRELSGDGYEFVWFPPYAPLVDPVEFVWGWSKRRAANAERQDKNELFSEVCSTLNEAGCDQARLRGFFAHAGLPL